MATVRNFEVMSDKYNIHRVHTQVTSSRQKWNTFTATVVVVVVVVVMYS